MFTFSPDVVRIVFGEGRLLADPIMQACPRTPCMSVMQPINQALLGIGKSLRVLARTPPMRWQI